MYTHTQLNELVGDYIGTEWPNIIAGINFQALPPPNIHWQIAAVPPGAIQSVVSSEWSSLVENLHISLNYHHDWFCMLEEDSHSLNTLTGREQVLLHKHIVCMLKITSTGDVRYVCSVV